MIGAGEGDGKGEREGLNMGCTVRARRQPGDPTSRRDLGLDHTWSANKHSTFWLQSIGMNYARAQAGSVLALIAKNSK